MDYAARTKYDDLAAVHYATDRFDGAVAAREARMVGDLLDRCRPVRLALDAPCGTGRLTPVLAARAARVVGVVLSSSMLRHAGHVPARVRGDCERLPFADGRFDVVQCVRLLHHLPTEAQLEGCLRELARVSSRWVLVSYFRTLSLAHLRRRLKGLFRERANHRRSISWATLRGAAARAGLRPVGSRCSAPLFSEQWFVLFERAE